MRPLDNEPEQQEIERLVTDEERQVLQGPTVPDEVKSEIMERLGRFREIDREQVQAEDARNAL